MGKATAMSVAAKRSVKDAEQSIAMFNAHEFLSGAAEWKDHRRNLSVEEHAEIHRRTPNEVAAHSH